MSPRDPGAAQTIRIRGTRSNYVSDEDAARLRLYGVTVDEVPAGHFVHVDALNELIALLVERTR